MELLCRALQCESSPAGPGWPGASTKPICSARPCPPEEFVATPAHGVWSETPSQGQLAGFSSNKVLQKLFTSLDYFFEGDPLQWSSFGEPDFVLMRQQEAEAVVGFSWHVDSSKQINLNLLSWVFRGSTANHLPTE